MIEFLDLWLSHYLFAYELSDCLLVVYTMFTRWIWECVIGHIHHRYKQPKDNAIVQLRGKN